MGGVEGECFAAAGLAVAGFLNASDFVVNVIKDAASLVGALDQVAGFVVGVAAVDGAAGQRVLFAAEIVKEQMVQTTSKKMKIVRSSEKQKLRACNIHPTSGLKVLCGLRLAICIKE